MGFITKKYLWCAAIALLSISILPGCGHFAQNSRKTVSNTTQSSIKNTRKNSAKRATELCPLLGKPITIIVHGTRFHPLLMATVPVLACQVCTPAGLWPVTEISQFYLFSRLGRLLARTDPEQFPLENSYLFGWSGALCFQARERAGAKLYAYLRALRDNPCYSSSTITVITVSHGGNAALNIARQAEREGYTKPLVDRLVMLASPVQQDTHDLVMSPVFKKVYHFYSLGDLVQVIDPQGLYNECSTLTKSDEQLIKPFFSCHEFTVPEEYKFFSAITQIEVRRYNRTVSHIDFAMVPFIKRLPFILNKLEDKDWVASLPRNSHNNTILEISLIPKNYQVCQKQ